jgi:hypothetical protein
MILMILLISCVGIPQPAFTTSRVVDPNAAHYTGPACLEGETCTTPAGWNEGPGTKWTPGGLEYTFTNVGDLRVIELPDGRWRTEVQTYVRAEEADNVSQCWKLEWVEIKL